MSKFENKINRSKNPSKNTVKVSENKEFLLKILNNYKGERKKIHNYLGLINHNIKITKQLIDEVK